MSNMIIYVCVETEDEEIVAEYWMNHDDPNQRRVLGQQCRNAFEAGQSMFTCPVTKIGELP